MISQPSSAQALCSSLGATSARQARLFWAIHDVVLSGGIVLLLLASTAVPSFSQTTSFRTLAVFNGPNGYGPGHMSLLHGADGNFYGTTLFGGDNNRGTVFKVTPSGEVTVLHSFCPQNDCIDGDLPDTGLILGTDGNFYGTTTGGGQYLYYGTAFRITPAGVLTTLASFEGYPKGSGPAGPLVHDNEGNFYGTTEFGGDNAFGTVFRIAPPGELTTLYSFLGEEDGSSPYAGLVRANDGNLYGTTFAGGSFGPYCDYPGCGTVFRITPSGTLTSLYSFCSQPGCADGSRPWAGLIQGSDGNFYGTTSGGGASFAGTVFRITPEGSLRTVYSFCVQSSCLDGSQPVSGLVEGRDGKLYGTTSSGGAHSYGTVFQITPEGTLTTLHSFHNDDGMGPWGGVVQGPDGFLYGSTEAGGSGGNGGTIFRVGLVCASAICQASGAR